MKAIDCALIVEDNETDRYVLRRRLKRAWPSIEILEAIDGQAAIDLLEEPGQLVPDVIFLDINMPRMDGLTFLETYYAEAGREVPVVMMLTSSERPDDKGRATSFRCVRAYATKPIEQAVIDDLPKTLG